MFETKVVGDVNFDGNRFKNLAAESLAAHPVGADRFPDRIYTLDGEDGLFITDGTNITNLLTGESVSPFEDARKIASDCAKGLRDDGLWIHSADSLYDGKRIGYYATVQLAKWRMKFVDHAYSNNSLDFWANPANIQKSVTADIASIDSHYSDLGIVGGTGEGVIISIAFGNNNSQQADAAAYKARLYEGCDLILDAYPDVTFLLVGVPKSSEDSINDLANAAFIQAQDERGYAYTDTFASTSLIHGGLLGNNYYVDQIHLSTAGGASCWNQVFANVQDDFLKAKMTLQELPADPSIENDVNLVLNVGPVDGEDPDIRASQLIEIPLGGYGFTYESSGNLKKVKLYDENEQLIINATVNTTQTPNFVQFRQYMNGKYVRAYFSDEGAAYDSSGDIPEFRFLKYPSVTKLLTQTEVNLYADVQNPSIECHCDLSGLETEPNAVATNDVGGTTPNDTTLNTLDITINDVAGSGSILKNTIELRDPVTLQSVNFGQTLSIAGKGDYTMLVDGILEWVPEVGLDGTAPVQYRWRNSDDNFSNWATIALTATVPSGNLIRIPGEASPNEWRDVYNAGDGATFTELGAVYPNTQNGWKKGANSCTVAAGQDFEMSFNLRSTLGGGHSDNSSGTALFMMTEVAETLSLSVGSYKIYLNGTQYGTWEFGTFNGWIDSNLNGSETYKIRRVGTQITYWMDSTLMYTSSVPSNSALFFQALINLNYGAKNIQIEEL